MRRKFKVYDSETKPGRRKTSASYRLKRSALPLQERTSWLKRPLADIISSEHCLSAPTDTEEATKPKLEPQRRSDTVPDLDRVCWKVWEKNRLAGSGGQAAIMKLTSKKILLFSRWANVMTRSPFHTNTSCLSLCSLLARQVKVHSHLGWDQVICKRKPVLRNDGMVPWRFT